MPIMCENVYKLQFRAIANHLYLNNNQKKIEEAKAWKKKRKERKKQKKNDNKYSKDRLHQSFAIFFILYLVDY